MLKIYHKKVKDKELKELDQLAAGSWVNVESPTEEEAVFLRDKLFLEEDLIKDATDPYEVPRLERQKDIIYFFTRVAIREDDGRVATTPILVAVTPGFVVTVSSRELKFLDNLKKAADFSTTQRTNLVLQIFESINAEYSKFFTEVTRKVRSSVANVERVRNEDIAQFVAFEEVLANFINSLVPTNASLRNILSGKFIGLHKEDEELIEDLLLHNTQLISNCEINLKSITNIREAYSSIMTNNLNQSIKILTVLTVIIAIPTLVTSFYGMNVSLPLSGSPFSYLMAIGISVVISALVLMIFIRNRWL
ncbi:MAG TPA: magnesium transporter CorA family protein [Candidatus Paceibacterota bacterium]|nr:magnesium transporter CorA family protein [Candidatus Paceibacterota bacterium]